MGTDDHSDQDTPERIEKALLKVDERFAARMERIANTFDDQTISSIKEMRALSLHLATASIAVVGVLGPVLLSIGEGDQTLLLVAMAGFVGVIVSAFWGVRRSLRHELSGLRWYSDKVTPAQNDALGLINLQLSDAAEKEAAIDKFRVKMQEWDRWSQQNEVGDGLHDFAFGAFVVSMILLAASLLPWPELIEWVGRISAYLGESGAPAP